MVADQYSSVSKMLHELSGDEQCNKEFDERIAKRRVLKRLISLRCAKKVSQSDVAEALGVTQSRISKIENGIDDDLRFGELKAYAKVCGMDMEIVFSDRDMTIVDEVKSHAFRIKHLLDRLAKCAERDDGITKGVAQFFGEAFFNMVRLMQNTARKLPKRKEDGRPHVCIQIQELPIEEADAGACDCDVFENEIEDESSVSG